MTFTPLNDESPYLGSTSTIGGMAQPRYSVDSWTPAFKEKAAVHPGLYAARAL
jgi:hypothetical protein